MEDLIMAKHYDKQFKLDAIQYYLNHKDYNVHIELDTISEK